MRRLGGQRIRGDPRRDRGECNKFDLHISTPAQAGAGAGAGAAAISLWGNVGIFGCPKDFVHEIWLKLEINH